MYKKGKKLTEEAGVWSWSGIVFTAAFRREAETFLLQCYIVRERTAYKEKCGAWREWQFGFTKEINQNCNYGH